MCLVTVEKRALSPQQAHLIDERLSLEEHRNDLGPPKVWAGYASGLFAYFEETSGNLVALVEASGLNDVSPGWWIDKAFRGRGYGRKLIDQLAIDLKKRGVTRIGRMPITTYKQEYDEQSKKLAQRLRKHFE